MRPGPQARTRAGHARPLRTSATADCFGFDVLPPEHSYTLVQIRTMLPQSAQYRFDPDEKSFKARVTEKLNAFD